MTREIPIAGILYAVAIAVSVGLARLPFGALPRAGSGDGSALAVAFGDARKVISQGLLQKADSYFHGGVEMGRGRKKDCHGVGGHAKSGAPASTDAGTGHRNGATEHHAQSEAEGGHAHHHEHGAGCGCGECHGEHEAAAEAEESFWDEPFGWVNERVRAPHVDRHLDNERSVELVPLVWASVKADPHNLEGWGIGWFVLAREMRRTDLAWNLLEEGLKENPGSPAILQMMGSTAYDGGRGDLKQAEEYYHRAWKEGMAKCGGDPAKLDPEDEQALLYSLNYLAAFYEQRGDTASVDRIYADAKKFRDGHNFATAAIEERRTKKEN